MAWSFTKTQLQNMAADKRDVFLGRACGVFRRIEKLNRRIMSEDAFTTGEMDAIKVAAVDAFDRLPNPNDYTS